MIPLILAYLCGLGDFMFTNYWITKYGNDSSTNPVGWWINTNRHGRITKILVAAIIMIIIGALAQFYAALALVPYIILTIYASIVIFHLLVLIYLGGQQ